MEFKNDIDRQRLASIAPNTLQLAGDGFFLGDTHAAGRIRFGAEGGRVTPQMQARMASAIPIWSKEAITYGVVVEGGDPFNVGLDLQLLARPATGLDAGRQAIAQSYALAWQLECFTKPTISLMDGLVTGAGIGMSLYGTHRVAGERYRFRVSGPAQGWFPDHGVAWVLAQLPGAIGAYLALTGAEIGRADAYRLGLLTHCIPAAIFARLAERLSDADPVDPLLDDLNDVPDDSALGAHLACIARCFSAPSLAQIMVRLQVEQGPSAQWAHSIRNNLSQISPVLAAITLRLLREARQGDLRDALLRDYRVAYRLLGSPPAATAGEADDVTSYFADLGPAELHLASRAQMQAPVI